MTKKDEDDMLDEEVDEIGLDEDDIVIPEDRKAHHYKSYKQGGGQRCQKR